MVALGCLFAASATFVVHRSEGQTSCGHPNQKHLLSLYVSTADEAPVLAWIVVATALL